MRLRETNLTKDEERHQELRQQGQEQVLIDLLMSAALTTVLTAGLLLLCSKKRKEKKNKGQKNKEKEGKERLHLSALFNEKPSILLGCPQKDVQQLASGCYRLMM